MDRASSIHIPEAIRNIANSADRRLAIEFFIFFSRFEYALKRAGYAKGNAKGVDPDWDEFGRKWNSKFHHGCVGELKACWDYFWSNPPKKQVLLETRLDWVPALPSKPDDSPNLGWLLTMIRRVRNNLFHGGKFQQPVPDASRDWELLEKSSAVLSECLKYDSDLKERFDESLDA